MRKLRLALITLLLFTLTGCYDATELDTIAHALVIGVDKGISNKWRLTVQFPTLTEQTGGGAKTGAGEGENGGGGPKEQNGYTSITVDAPSFFTGINMINSTLPRILSFVQAKFLVFSEELAREGLIGEFIAPIIRFRQIRRTLHLLVSRSAAMEFIQENKPFIGGALSKSLETIMEEASSGGFIIHSTLDKFYNDLKSTASQPIAHLTAVNDFKAFKMTGEKWGEEFKQGGDYLAGELPRYGGPKNDLFGSALFDGDKMVGLLNGDETRLLRMVRGDFKREFFTIPDPKGPALAIPLDLRQMRKPGVKIRIIEDKPVIDLKIRLEGDILAIQSRIAYENPELKPVLEKAFAEYVNAELGKLFEKCKSLNADVFGFGKEAIKGFHTIQEWEEYNWLKNFSVSEIHSEVEFVIRRTGSQLMSAPIVSSRGKE